MRYLALQRSTIVTLPALLLGLGWIGGCATETTPEKTSVGTTQFDPVGGRYPAILWMVQVVESDTAPGWPNGYVATDAAATETLMASLRALPTRSNGAALADAGEATAMNAAEPGKGGGMAAGESFALTEDASAPDATAVQVRWTWGGATVESAGRVPTGGAIVLTRIERERGSWRIAVVRPSAIRSLAEYPFQTSSSPAP
jgi:hypothetical protein